MSILSLRNSNVVVKPPNNSLDLASCVVLMFNHGTDFGLSSQLGSVNILHRTGVSVITAARIWNILLAFLSSTSRRQRHGSQAWTLLILAFVVSRWPPLSGGPERGLQSESDEMTSIHETQRRAPLASGSVLEFQEGTRSSPFVSCQLNLLTLGSDRFTAGPGSDREAWKYRSKPPSYHRKISRFCPAVDRWVFRASTGP
ncbi:hypothetical protein LshimejAT787_1701570 [Lyophyllum shimeji]|uniref:Uncharacterized protein n=1 Tax=Lyophyllum shimeji TaxID=47721 RepID=A0A9P3UUA5_LYOSH|nr:hypothetical protein LshimejAT787_1701570 [Lyophyllum shimeji]